MTISERTDPRDKFGYSPREVAKLTPRGEAWVYAALASGALVGKQPDRNCPWVISRKAVDDWVDRGCPRFPARKAG